MGLSPQKDDKYPLLGDITTNYCDLRGRIKGTAPTLKAIQSAEYYMANIVRTILAI